MIPRLRQYHRLGSALLATDTALLAWGIWAGFVADQDLAISYQIAGHITVMLGGALLKLGYVLRLACEHEIRQLPAI